MFISPIVTSGTAARPDYCASGSPKRQLHLHRFPGALAKAHAGAPPFHAGERQQFRAQGVRIELALAGGTVPAGLAATERAAGSNRVDGTNTAGELAQELGQAAANSADADAYESPGSRSPRTTPRGGGRDRDGGRDCLGRRDSRPPHRRRSRRCRGADRPIAAPSPGAMVTSHTGRESRAAESRRVRGHRSRRPGCRPPPRPAARDNRRTDRRRMPSPRGTVGSATSR